MYINTLSTKKFGLPQVMLQTFDLHIICIYYYNLLLPRGNLLVAERHVFTTPLNFRYLFVCLSVCVFVCLSVCLFFRTNEIFVKSWKNDPSRNRTRVLRLKDMITTNYTNTTKLK